MLYWETSSHEKRLYGSGLAMPTWQGVSPRGTGFVRCLVPVGMDGMEGGSFGLPERGNTEAVEVSFQETYIAIPREVERAESI